DNRMDFVLYNSASGGERSYISNGMGGFSNVDNYWNVGRMVDSAGGQTQDFVLSATSLTIPAGQSANGTVSHTPLNGFNSQVNLTCNWPSGFTGGCSPTFVNPNSSAGYTVTVGSSVAAGAYYVTI